MKNEERILELLAQMVRKADQNDKLMRQMNERINLSEERINLSEERINLSEERLNNLDDISRGVLVLLRDLAKRSGETAELRDRIARLEKRVGL